MFYALLLCTLTFVEKIITWYIKKEHISLKNSKIIPFKNTFFLTFYMLYVYYNILQYLKKIKRDI